MGVTMATVQEMVAMAMTVAKCETVVPLDRFYGMFGCYGQLLCVVAMGLPVESCHMVAEEKFMYIIAVFIGNDIY